MVEDDDRAISSAEGSDAGTRGLMGDDARTYASPQPGRSDGDLQSSSADVHPSATMDSDHGHDAPLCSAAHRGTVAAEASYSSTFSEQISLGNSHGSPDLAGAHSTSFSEVQEPLDPSHPGCFHPTDPAPQTTWEWSDDDEDGWADAGIVGSDAEEAHRLLADDELVGELDGDDIDDTFVVHAMAVAPVRLSCCRDSV